MSRPTNTVVTRPVYTSSLVQSQDKYLWSSNDSAQEPSESDSLGRSKLPKAYPSYEIPIPTRLRIQRPAFDSVSISHFGQLLQDVKQEDIATVRQVYVSRPERIAGKWTGTDRTRRILLELKTACTWAPWLSIAPIDGDINNTLASMEGPIGTPYEGGIFYLHVVFPPEYPFKSPSMRFVTRVYHPNIDERGYVCLDTLKDGWTAAHTISSVLACVHLLFSEPVFDDPLVPFIARQYYEDRSGFLKTAKQYTDECATGERPDMGFL